MDRPGVLLTGPKEPSLPRRLSREHPGVELPDGLTLILNVLLDIRAGVEAILELLEEEENGNGQREEEEDS